MTDLERKVFGKITTKEIIGSFPVAIPDTKERLELELGDLTRNLKSQTKEQLKKLLEEQKISEKHVNSRPGAMALAQDKIKLFTEYSQKYIRRINERLQI